MKKSIFIAFLGLSMSTFAQQVPQYSQYLRNQYMVNPAAAGVYDFVDLTLSGRWQWIGFGDEPRTTYLSGSTVLGKATKPKYNPAYRSSVGPVRNPEINTGKTKHAMGGQLVADQYGAFRSFSFAGTYAIHLPIAKNHNLSFGTNVGLSNNQFLRDKAVVLNNSDPFANYSGGDEEYDDFIQNQSSKYIFDLGAGLYLYSKKMFLGFSASHLTKDMVEFGVGTANFNTQIHMNATGGIKFMINDNLSLMPAVLVKLMSPAPLSLEGSIQLEYKEWLWVGASYRNEDAIIGMVGLNVSEKFKFGYSYDFNISRMNQLSGGGHELVLGLMLGR